MQALTKDALIAEVRKKVAQFPTALKAATRLGITPAQLSRTLNGQVNVIPARLVKAMGYQAVTMYAPTRRAKKPAAPAARAETPAAPKPPAARTPPPTPRPVDDGTIVIDVRG